MHELFLAHCAERPFRPLPVCLPCRFQLALLFPDPSDVQDMQVLHTAAQLAGGGASSSSGEPSSSSSSDNAWAAFYAQPQARVCLMILSSWMPESLSTNFQRYHEVSGGVRGFGVALGACM